MMSKLVMKFVGASVEHIEKFSKVAALIKRRCQNFSNIIVVVSAMGSTTDKLLELAKCIHPNPPKREQDMLISIGERISSSLLAMALNRLDIEAISFTGSQSGIITTNEHANAQILEVRPQRLHSHLKQGKVVIIAGFQGVSQKGEITTLGRGGSDTSAVALAAALGAKIVQFYKDVPGIGVDNPQLDPETKIFSHLDYDQALAIAQRGADVLHSFCIQLAKEHKITLQIRPYYDPEVVGTVIKSKECVYV